MTSVDESDLLALDVAWDLSSLIPEARTPDDLVTEAIERAEALASNRGTVVHKSPAEMAALLTEIEAIAELVGRAGHYVMLRHSEQVTDPERGAALVSFEERSAQITTALLFFDLEWAAAPDETADSLMAAPELERYHHYLRKLRANRPHMLTEPEEAILAEKAVTGPSAWTRLHEELLSSVEVDRDGESVSLEMALSELGAPDRDQRRAAAAAVTKALTPGLSTRAFVYNTLLLDHAIDDRLRSFDRWISARNLANEATDASVEALVQAVVSRYDICQRWYGAKAEALGVERLADYDRAASVADSETRVTWSEGSQIVRDAYRSFSPDLADTVDRFIDDGWIDAPNRPGKRPGAFCAYGVPSDHPYVMLNWTGRLRDVLTLAHELGHGVHGYLARGQSLFTQSTPLTLAETASVFGEAVTNNALLATIDDPADRFALLAGTMDDAVATVFRQVAMNRFENAAHTARREEGELSVDRFGELWIASQHEMMGHSVELTDDYGIWWSYIPHFIFTPGYVYAYAYGQLLALSVYANYRQQGADFVPAYLELLSAGGSQPPEQLAAIVGCDLTDPGFWAAGLDLVDTMCDDAIAAGRAAGRIN